VGRIQSPKRQLEHPCTMGLINTLDRPSEFDAAAKLREGEPYFLLIGRDRQAPALVIQWAHDNRRRAVDEHDRGLITDDERDDELRKSLDAEQIAWAMQSYKAGWPDQPKDPLRASATESYSGHTLPEETQRRDAIQRLRTRTASHINQAVAELNNAAVEFRDLGLTDEAAALDAKVANLKRMSDLIAPPRRVLNR
jgi:hypothetical protein